MDRFLDVLCLFDSPEDQQWAEKLTVGLIQRGLSARVLAATLPHQMDAVRADTVVGIVSEDLPAGIHLAIQHRKRGLLLTQTTRPRPGTTVSVWQWSPPLDVTDDFFLGQIGDFCHQHRDYVRSHTDYLIRALAWANQHRQGDFLLPGEACQQAEDWLSQHFITEQPPCVPTQLQCEYISESLKQANGNMAQVCLVGDGTRENLDHMRRALMRSGITVWSPPWDVPAAADYGKALRWGVETADNLVLLVSAAAMARDSWQQALERAQKLHKRIIPVLLEPLSTRQMPAALQSLQGIDLTDKQGAHYGQNQQALIQILRKGETYHHWHKRILVQALAWEAQHRTKSKLLQGGEFAIAKDWLQKADLTTYPPTELHRDYIAASEEMNQFYDAFISYGRIDSKGFATELHQRLTEQGYRIWFDQSDIPLAVDFQEQIKTGIEKSHNFIYIIGPHAVNSPYCDQELALAQQYGKRVIPIMHVEAINYDTWLQRNPGGELSGWQSYQDRGLHSSYPNMKPAIRRLNWIFARPGQEDLQQFLQGLLQTLQRYGDYVEQHTYLLTKALYWERHQRQPQHFLTGQDRIEAEAWLTRRFEETQAPCEPIALHSEYICGSIKYADGWMTQLFLAHSEADRELEERLRLGLMREGITVWSSKVDIPYGKDFQSEIFRGIENTDNVLILLSVSALESPYCQRELAYAFELNKRIIPVLIEPLENLIAHFQDNPANEGAQLFKQLQRLQFINFINRDSSEAFHHNLDKVLQLLNTNRRYYHEHKELLVRALKWQRQRQNASILLQGAMLRYYQGWLEMARHQPQPPTELQLAYLQASWNQPPRLTLDVFIACAPQDLEFARKLNEVLQVQGKTTWFPYESALGITPSGEETQAELESAQNILLVVSPYWVDSESCQGQLQTALSLNKRVIPLIYQPVDAADLPQDLAHLPTIDFYTSADFLTTFGQLYRLLESDPEYVRGHTRLLVRSREWQRSGEDDSFLLRGTELREGLAWLQQTENKVPQPTPLQRRYLEASQALPRRRVRRRTVAASGLAMGVGVALLRLLGAWEGLELAAYDQMLKLRPAEKPDPHLLMVTVDDTSSAWLREQLKQRVFTPGIGTIPEGALAQTLEILGKHDPALIGLDFYRDFEADPVVAQHLSQMDRLILLCKASYEGKGVLPPPEVPLERVGFNDFSKDRRQYVRRHLIKQAADEEFCPTEEAFSLQLARRYLAQQGIDYQDPWADAADRPLMFGDRRVPQLNAARLLTSRSGGYAPLHWQRLQGFQTLVNFRAVRTDERARDVENFAPIVPLQAVLQEKVDPELIRDRIVIIGYSDFSDRSTDYYNTPYGGMAGVFLQGQMTSQLIAAALEGRPLISAWPAWGDALWIVFWGATGASLPWWLVRTNRLGAASLGVGGILGGVCYGGLLVGIWLPMVPALMAGLAGGTLTAYFTYRIRHP